MRIATRSSPLALWQARAVADALTAGGAAGVEVELVPVRTSGDVDLATPIAQMSGRGVFVTEVQRAVLDGRADIAVHSAKDMRSDPTEGLTLAGCLARGDARDALVGMRLDEIPGGGVVATGSARRECQLRAVRSDLRFVGLRGNIARRLSILDEAPQLETGGRVSAVAVAAAALDRLGQAHRIAQRFEPTEMVPQVGQGAIALEHRADDPAAGLAAGLAIDVATTRCVNAERAFLHTLGGGCELPTGAYATVGDDGRLVMVAMLATPERDRIERASGEGATRYDAEHAHRGARAQHRLGGNGHAHYWHADEALGIALARELLDRVGADPDAWR